MKHHTPTSKVFSPAFLSGGWPLAVAAMCACWLLLFGELHREWDINPQYNYGYTVPLLGALLCWRRWLERPPASAGQSILAGWIAGVSLSLLLPLNLFLEANPEWRLLYWIHGFIVLILSLCLLYRAGGRVWMKFFAPPLLFMLIAIPWPMGLEQIMIQNLMRFVAGLTVNVIGWLGIPAVQHGNLIQVGTGVVGINEACSGVRSLQTALMVSLFLGEIHRFTTGRRAALMGASLVCVIVANVFRTSLLTWLAANRGVHQMEAWHDSAGVIVMVMVLAGLFGLGYWMKPKGAKSAGNPNNAALPLPVLPRWAAISVFAWLGATGLATEIWFGIHERNLAANKAWIVSWPTRAYHFQKTAVPGESLSILRCSDSGAAQWEDVEGNQWNAFFLRWSAGKNSTQLAYGHRPDICYPAAGEKLVENYGRIVVNANGIEMPFTYQTFQNGSYPMHVFYCLWSDRTSRQDKTLLKDGSWKSRLQAVLAGERNLGQQVLEVDVIGPQTSATALSLFKQELPKLVRPD